MSTAAITTAGDAPPLAPAPSLARLTRVELRKMVDTRAGLWLQISVAALTVAVAVLIVAFGNDVDRTFASLLGATVQPAGYLLPVIGILLVTSEFNQRTALITFALVPHRLRVLGAKALAAVVVALIAFAICLVVAGLAALAGGGGDGGVGSETTLGLVGQCGLLVVVGMVTGVAFGLAAKTSAPAIVAYFLVPIAWALLGEIPGLGGVWEWIDPARSLELLVDRHLSGTEWAKAVLSMGLFIVVPAAIGLWRLRREELP